MPRFYSYSVCLCLLLLSFSWKASAQAAIVIGEPKVSEKYSRESAEKALKEGTANLLMITGGTVYVIHSGQEKFKKKYPQLVPSMKLLDYKGMKCVYVARSDDSSVLMGLRDELPESLRDIWIYS